MKKKKLACKEVLNERLAKEINANKVSIDRSVFSNSAEEKLKLKELKNSVETMEHIRTNTILKQVQKYTPKFGSITVGMW